MVPDALTNFFIASAGAGAALLGLLFVSISISPEEKITTNASTEKRISAYSALGSLIDAFFISLVALIPNNFGISVLVFGALSLVIAIQNSIQLLRPHEGASSLARRLTLTVLNLLAYIAQCYLAVQLIDQPARFSAGLLADYLTAGGLYTGHISRLGTIGRHAQHANKNAHVHTSTKDFIFRRGRERYGCP